MDNRATADAINGLLDAVSTTITNDEKIPITESNRSRLLLPCQIDANRGIEVAASVPANIG